MPGRTTVETLAARDRTWLAACTCGWEQRCGTRGGAHLLADHHRGARRRHEANACVTLVANDAD